MPFSSKLVHGAIQGGPEWSGWSGCLSHNLKTSIDDHYGYITTGATMLQKQTRSFRKDRSAPDLRTFQPDYVIQTYLQRREKEIEQLGQSAARWAASAGFRNLDVAEACNPEMDGSKFLPLAHGNARRSAATIEELRRNRALSHAYRPAELWTESRTITNPGKRCAPSGIFSEKMIFDFEKNPGRENLKI